MAEIEVCTDPESGKYAPLDPEQHITINKERRKITIFYDTY
jgi:hypothetical protein